MDNVFEKCDIISVMPDYGGAYLWSKLEGERGIGANIADAWCGYQDWLPISESLQMQFHEWQGQFEKVDFYPCEDEEGNASDEILNWQGETVDWNWATYHAEGLRLAKLLKLEVGDQVKVHYVKPYEDFNAVERAMEILLDGTVVILD
ncbi:MAG: hypothetical protein Q4B82_06275 [Alysiella sp.]|uniref:hypothetical protein n=1 Tax=Alysiella sp. TaxID=1872483 RepID=UPI0026DBE50E|nr:hypothetical protein [Alysiella sp.]MDO4434167.1 hypothetical protein [Alysiella sp.]